MVGGGNGMWECKVHEDVTTIKNGINVALVLMGDNIDSMNS